ncbi:MAG: methyltransferase domain-containing protein [Candidatus Omnitrophota bacterium]
MHKRKRIDSKEIGLELALIFGGYFLKTEDLHYGYWTGDLDLNLSNLSRAQENYSNFIISHIPKNVKTVLDVGCGAGRFAHRLTNLGYQVDCVSPSPLLTERARSLLKNNSRIFECRYEQLRSERPYDLILFSESFQYVDMEKALQKSGKLLNDAGHLLICDFFKTEAEGKSFLGGGHRLTQFYDVIQRHPFELVENIDITGETAPNLDLENAFLVNCGFPVWKLALRFLDDRHSLLVKFLRWKFRTKIKKINQKYFAGARNAQQFATFKTYRLFLYKKTG